MSVRQMGDLIDLVQAGKVTGVLKIDTFRRSLNLLLSCRDVW